MKKIVLVILSLFIILTGCSTTKTQQTSSQKQASESQRLLQPKQVVESYFKYLNEKNKKALFTTITEWQKAPNVEWGFDIREYIKLISVNEETNPVFKEGYLSNGRGSINGVKKENVKVYKVDYDVKYKEDAITAEDNGKNTSWFFVVRKDKNSPWLIDSQGQP
ncbi:MULTISPECIES: DUF4829 domain-containing protein [Clostridium]|uniref:DUF4829 domain-containing protein n=1 Tax=Clostridium ragsdalei P11 TaxID=1353534 RepID=A0A1A6AW30_9CLOT|nr:MULTISPECIES: DUF4829 domain-containing protein [Clostridium]OBR94240.1 hypothetical protein CLRAG_16310 [Clostridium ragsdalei P11]QXE18266.1 hypothetical protein B5S50_05115 [Clostridium sp. 001]